MCLYPEAHTSPVLIRSVFFLQINKATLCIKGCSQFHNCLKYEAKIKQKNNSKNTNLTRTFLRFSSFGNGKKGVIFPNASFIGILSQRIVRSIRSNDDLISEKIGSGSMVSLVVFRDH